MPRRRNETDAPPEAFLLELDKHITPHQTHLMKLRKLSTITASLALASLLVSLHAAPNDFTQAQTSRKALHVNINDVVLIKSTSDAVAVVQFTSFESGTASYRWRYRSAESESIISGKGQTRESYDSKPAADGSVFVTPKADHDVTVRAGDLKVEWSSMNTTSGWLYYNSSIATMQVTGSGSGAFKRKF